MVMIRRMFSSISRIEMLGYKLPPNVQNTFLQQTTSVYGNLLFVSGHLPIKSDGTLVVGKLGKTLTQFEGRCAARMCGLGILSSIHNSIGLNNVVKIHKIKGFVNCSEDFDHHSHVIDGCSELLREVFGDSGNHAMTVIGVTNLSDGVPVAIEALIEFNPPSDGLLGK